MNELARLDPFKMVAGDDGRDPFRDSLFDLVPAFFRPIARSSGFTGMRMDVAEQEGAYHLAVELPGVKKEAIQVSVYDNTVTINADLREEKQAQEGTTWLLRERGTGKLSRALQLPEAVDEAGSEAKYSEGVLYLMLKKKRDSQTKRLAIH
jgi:HSP20 family protein